MSDLDLMIVEAFRDRLTKAETIDRVVVPWLKSQGLKPDDELVAWAASQIEAVYGRLIGTWQS